MTEQLAETEARADYAAFLATKRVIAQSSGVEVQDAEINPILFPFQRDLVRWALRKGRAAIFADTGLGKTFMQIEWARLTGKRTLIVAPLSVARQTVREGARLGVEVVYARKQEDARAGIAITNYEMIQHFEAADFEAVVLDESSILKSLDGKTRQRLTDQFGAIPFKLCCTATPAPNDIAELANHAEFLGVMSRAEMLAMFFVHVADNAGGKVQGWRLKGHAEPPFYRWLSSWGMSVRRPSDLGYSDEGYILPPLNVEPVWVESDWRPENQLFFTGLQGIQGRSAVRKGTLEERVRVAAELAGDGNQWIFWCGLNEESRMLTEAIPAAVEVCGDHSPEEKTAALEGFQDGTVRVLVTKPRIAGFGMNFQNCHKMAFVGLSDSWESYYQCIRRCYRFGQEQPVTAYIVLSDAEGAIYDNVMRKEKDAIRMADELMQHVREFENIEIHGVAEDYEYQTGEQSGDNWRLMLGDSNERMAEIADNSVDLSVFSPPFLSIYTYSPTERDVGNCRTDAEFLAHMQRIIDNLLRVTKPGRNACVHVSQIAMTLVKDGVIGMKDFRGMMIRAFSDRGWIYHGEICIDKDPQAQAIRTKAKGLLFVQLRKDASWLRPAYADYILLFRKPGENPEPVLPDITNEDWIQWARPIWYNIRESDTLNAAEGRESDDERHIAPLQLGTIERCVRLWSNKGDMVLDPFAGIGSTGYVALKHGRRFVGCELKPGYFRAAVRNLKAAESSKVDLFSYVEPSSPGSNSSQNEKAEVKRPQPIAVNPQPSADNGAGPPCHPQAEVVAGNVVCAECD